MQLIPDGGYYYVQLAQLYALRGDYERAEVAGRKAVELQDRALSGSEGLEILGAHVKLGYALYRQGRYDEAITEYERGLEFLASIEHALRDRTRIEAHQKLSAVYYRKGQMEDADRHLQQAVAGFQEGLAREIQDPANGYYLASL